MAMKKLLKVLKVTGISLAILLVLLIILPIIFKKPLVARIKSEINNSLTATVGFSDVDISLLRRFPRLSVKLKDVEVVGQDVFAKDTLVSAPGIDVALNLMSLFGDELSIQRVTLQQPRIHALVNKDGAANWDIVKETAADPASQKDTSASSFRMKLNEYRIEDGYVFYDDVPGNMRAEINGLDHSGSGDFTDEVFTLSTNTTSDAVYFSYGGIPYLNNFKTDIASDIVVDQKTGTYSFKDLALTMNELRLNADGSFRLLNDSSYRMDISFDAPDAAFKSILSLVPGIYKKDFEDIKTSGTASLKGFVKGIYSPQQLPAYDLSVLVKNGFFQYPQLPQPVKNIGFSLKASNPDGLADNAVIQLENGHIEMDNEPFDFNFIFRKPETEKYIDAKAKGKINLARVASFVKLEEGTKLGGVLNADVFAKGSMAAMDGGSGSFGAGGFLQVASLLYQSKAFPRAIQNGSIKVDLVNTNGVADQTSVKISNGHVELGQDAIDFTLNLNHPMTTMNFDGTAKGGFALDGIKQFTALEPGTNISGKMLADLSFAGSKPEIDKGNYNASGTVNFSEVNYVSKEYPKGIQLAAADLQFNPASVRLSRLAGTYGISHFTASGVLNNLLAYMFKNETLHGGLEVGVDQLNLNEWMQTDAAATTKADSATVTASSSAPFEVPANVDLSLHAKAGRVSYDKVDYRNVEGNLLVANEAVELKNVRTEALDGVISFNGAYSTKADRLNPAINLSYDVKGVSVQKAFTAFNTVKSLMPIGQFLDGKLSSQLSMKGKLNGELMPQLGSLSGNGSLLLLEGVLKKFAPLEKIASTLNITELQNLSLRDLKSYIEFANGKVLVKPFNLKVKDIDMQVGGMHGFDQTMDYLVQMKLPRSYLGTAGNNLVNGLAAKAAAKGVPVKLGETVNLVLKLGGSISNPTIQTELKESAGDALATLKEQAVAFAQQKRDTLKQALKDTAQAIKKQVTEDVKEEIKKQIFGTKDSAGNRPSLDSTKKKTTETLKNTFKGLIKKKNQ